MFTTAVEISFRIIKFIIENLMRLSLYIEKFIIKLIFWSSVRGAKWAAKVTYTYSSKEAGK